MKKTEQKVLEFVKVLVNSQKYSVNLSLSEIAFVTNTKRTTARRYLLYLADQGIIKIDNASSNKQCYRIMKGKYNSFVYGS